jgi:hypothetical protein
MVSNLSLAKALVVALGLETGMCGHNGYIAEQCRGLGPEACCMYNTKNCASAQAI